MLPPLADLVLSFCKITLIPLAVGATCYLIFRGIHLTSKQLMWGFGLYLFGLSLMTRWDQEFFGFGIILLIPSAIVSKAGAWAHGKSTDSREPGWESSYIRVLASTLLSLTVGMFLSIVPWYVAWSRQSMFDDPLIYIVTPSMMAVLVWISKSMRLRPGLDIPFETQGEHEK